MPGLTDNEARALAYFAIGVTSEGGDKAYQLSLAGNITHDAQGNALLHPVGNSGYSIGTLQTDLGQHPEVARQLTDGYQAWAQSNHPEWALSAAQRTTAIDDLSRNGRTINAQHQRDMDPTVKSHMQAYLASADGQSFIHERDIAQVDKLMTDVVTPLRGSQLYQHASPADQAKLIAITAKAYNQSESIGGTVLGHVTDGTYRSVADVSAAIDQRPDYMQSGRDAALRGTSLFNQLQQASAGNPMHSAWQDVLANPQVNPTRLANDAARPNLPHEYAVVKDAFVDTAHSAPMINALEHGGSYAKTASGRGFYVEGHDMVTWNRAGVGHAAINGQWSSVQGRDVTTVGNSDHTLDVKVRRNGADEQLLHITHPGQPAGHRAPTANASGDHVQRAGTVREHDHGPEVKALQAQLNQLGYKGANGQPITPDGDFGGNTKAALESFQRANHLTADGIAGSSTLGALQRATQPAQAPATLADAAHPGHAMYQQATAAVHRLDAEQGRSPDAMSANIAASLAVAAQARGMQRIDHVVLSDDASRAYAVQGDIQSPLKRVAEVDVVRAVGTSVAQSSSDWHQQTPRSAPSVTPVQQYADQPGLTR